MIYDKSSKLRFAKKKFLNSSLLFSTKKNIERIELQIELELMNN